MNKKVSTLKIAGVYIGTVIGAGFATGQEILQFFANFGINGIWGLGLTTLLFIFFGFIIIELGFKLNAKSHLELLQASSKGILTVLMDLIITFFLFGFLVTMFAGTGALLTQQLGWPSILGSLIMAIITAVTVLTGIKGVINAISSIAPFLLLTVFGMSIYTVIKYPPNFSAFASANANGLINNWFISAILYTACNMILSASVLGPLGANSKDKKAILYGAVLGGLGLGAGAFMIFLALSSQLNTIADLEVPMIYIAGQISPIVQGLFSVVLIGEIFSTAVGSLYGFSARILEFPKLMNNNKLVVIGFTTIAFFASLFGFSNLVKYLYPIAGYAGILLLGCFLFSWVRGKLASN